VSLRTRLFATGIRRAGSPRTGFRYRTAGGKRVRDEDRRRIEALRIPPAWQQVHIATSPRARIQAIGCDAAGRWQYRYRISHVERRSREQFDRLLEFGAALPPLRRELLRDLARRGLPREKALACAVAVLTTCFLRPGTEVYAVENGSYGLATLRNQHVTIEGACIRFDFRGKHGQRQRHELRSATLARIIAAMKRLPGTEVFKFVDEEGRVRDLRRRHMNDYIKQAMGAPFSAKVFRTWGGTLLCAGELAVAGRNLATAGRSSARARRAATAAALRETAARLGNTVAACRRSYVHPGLLTAFARGRTVSACLSRPEALLALGRRGLDRSERSLLELLRRERAGTR
jgi:DNA topoisomerase-1